MLALQRTRASLLATGGIEDTSTIGCDARPSTAHDEQSDAARLSAPPDVPHVLPHFALTPREADSGAIPLQPPFSTPACVAAHGEPQRRDDKALFMEAETNYPIEDATDQRLVAACDDAAPSLYAAAPALPAAALPFTNGAGAVYTPLRQGRLAAWQTAAAADPFHSDWPFWSRAVSASSAAAAADVSDPASVPAEPAAAHIPAEPAAESILAEAPPPSPPTAAQPLPS